MHYGGPSIYQDLMQKHVHSKDTASVDRLADLPPENVTGHTKKVLVFKDCIERVRRRHPRGPLQILDVGCGSGYAVTRFLGQPGDSVLGVDLYEPNIAYAKRHFEKPGLMFELRTAESLATDANKFDVIILADILEHLSDPNSVLVGCRKLLAPNGSLLITVPNGYGPFELESALARLPILGKALLKVTDYFVAVLNKVGPLKGTWTSAAAHMPPDLPYNLESGHVQFFTRSRLHMLLLDAGYRVVGTENISFLSGPFTNYLFGAWPAFCRWNAAVANSVPSFMCSAWYFECEASP
jgi:2-polyprenyl-3-methyl-5-hydroxy-6-metoxy-1,4-benzoquinol methylase